MGEANKRRKLMDDKRQNIQLVLAFEEEDRGEAPKDLGEGTESSAGGRGTESPAIGEQLMEMRFQLLRQEICGQENCKQALVSGPPVEACFASIETSQGQQGESGSGWDDRPRAAGVPETALASNSGTVAEWNL